MLWTYRASTLLKQTYRIRPRSSDAAAIARKVFPVPAVLPAWALAAGLFALNALELAFVVSSTAYLAHLIGIAAGAAIGLALRRREARRG